jgi:alkylation response protein AidB-like acyl-CoA dehydrogenase
MKTPGITVKPIIVLDGAHEVNEVFFDNVKVPVENRVGEENKGWTYAKFLLVHERSGIAGVARSKKAIERLREIAGAETVDGKPLIETDEFSRKIAELQIDLSALEFTELRTLAAESKGEHAGPQSSILKIKGTEIQQRITELTVEAIGYYAYPDDRGFGDNEYPVGPDYAVGQSGIISICAKPRSMAAPTRSSATSSPRPCWDFDAIAFVRIPAGAGPTRPTKLARAFRDHSRDDAHGFLFHRGADAAPQFGLQIPRRSITNSNSSRRIRAPIRAGVRVPGSNSPNWA